MESAYQQFTQVAELPWGSRGAAALYKENEQRKEQNAKLEPIYRPKPTAIIGSVSSDICVQFGRRIRTLRKQLGWTQVYMAEHVGLNRSFISDLENGRKEVCIRSLELVATGFSMTISKLMSRL